jgi:hypothetical protein
MNFEKNSGFVHGHENQSLGSRRGGAMNEILTI